MIFIYIFFLKITPLHGRSHAVFRGFISILGGWLQYCKELIIMAEDGGPHITVWNKILSGCGVLAGVTVL